MSDQRILPSKMALQAMKGKEKGAKKGHKLLKQKADALKKRFTEVMKELIETKSDLGDQMTEAFLLLANANYAAGDFSRNVIEGVKRSKIRVEMGRDNVAGVNMPIFKLRKVEDDENELNHLGISQGGHAIKACGDKFTEVLEAMIKISSLQASFLILDEVIKITNRRVNALDNVVIPRIQRTIKGIKKALDELDREAFFRLKKVQDKKKKKKAQQQSQAEEEASRRLAKQEEGKSILDQQSENILQNNEDDDLEF